MYISRVSIAVLCAAAAAYAVETKYWQESEMADFEKGSLTGLSLASDGRLTLAPVMKEIFDPSVTFLWAVARDSKGNLYAGGGGLGSSKAKLFMVDPSGKAKTVAEIDGLAIQAIAIDRQDRVYAATAPDGKVYRVDRAGKAEVFYDPHAKYIWALAFSKAGDLYVATGDQGEIHRVSPSGSGSVFFRTEETHARSLAMDASGNLIVGTDPSGLILRITPAGDGFVLYQAPKREITALAVAADGTIYAAGAGNKQPAIAPSIPVNPAPAPPGLNTLNLNGPARPNMPPPPTLAGPNQAVAGGSEIDRIQTDGYARKVWSHPRELVYALAFDARGRLVAGTGNHGSVYRLDSDYSYTRLLNVAPTQITGFCAAPDGRLYAVTGNIGKILAIGPELESSGTFDSDVFDAGAFSYWGRLSDESTDAAAISFETRSGNLDRPQKNWSAWAKLDEGRVVSPAARFLQYRATLSASKRAPPEVTEVDIAYQMRNIAPAIEELEITPANYKFPAPQPAPPPGNQTLNLPPLGRANPSPPFLPSSDVGASPALTWSKGQIGARWLANDENGDALTFKIEIRGVNEIAWKPLADKIREHYFSWDSSAFPDGKYVLRVTASDAPSNPPDQALSSSRESEPFLIDNTPPEITDLRGTSAGGRIEVRFHAKDALSVLDKAEYSVNGGEWLAVDPTTRLTDSMDQNYRLLLDRSAMGNPPEATIAVRVSDEYENQAVAKIVVK
jgi:outer membrane protein assembly factor BamB